MAVVGNRRRHQTLTLELPLAPTSTRLPPPSAPSTTSTPLSDYDKLEVLGHGDGGTVYKVRHRATSSLFALKLLRPDRRHAREFTALRLASSSPLVVRCHAFLSDSALLLEFMDAGTLYTLLQRHHRLPPASLPYLSRRVLLALSHLHSLHIVHRDVKPSNVLVDTTGEIKISDFGVSRVMTRSLDPCDSYVGTCAYMSPERFDPETYGAKYDGYAADVWSLGLTVMELYLGRFPLVPKGERPDWATLMCAICFGPPPPPEFARLGLSRVEEFRGLLSQEGAWREVVRRAVVGSSLCFRRSQRLQECVPPVAVVS